MDGSELVSTALEIAFEQVSKALERAQDRRNDDYTKCVALLEACSEAIKGLEGEYDAILLAADRLVADQKNVAALLQRIDDYLFKEKLRPKLIEALGGLIGYDEAFRGIGEQFLQWPWKRANREKAVKEFSSTLTSLQMYLDRLTTEGFGGGSGVDVRSLFELRALLEQGSKISTKEIKELVANAWKNRAKEPFLNLLKENKTLLVRLKTAFI
jgi:hypothetical protein